MQEQVNIQRNFIEALENDYKKKMEELSNILEISEGLEKLVHRQNDHCKPRSPCLIARMVKAEKAKGGAGKV